MIIRPNSLTRPLPSLPVEAPRANRAVAVKAADGFDAFAPASRPAPVPTTVPARGLGFDAREVAQPYDAAADLFPGLDWLDPRTYQPANPSKLPATQASEIQHMLDAQATRTPEQTAQALDLAHRGTFSLWMDYASQYGKEHGFLKGALLKAKLALALGVDGAVDGVKKLETHEPRPFQVDPRIHMLGDKPAGSSSPSGHAASAYAAATVLAEAMPERADEFYAAAANVARSRVYLGVHFPGDVAAGARLGMKVGEDF